MKNPKFVLAVIRLCSVLFVSFPHFPISTLRGSSYRHVDRSVRGECRRCTDFGSAVGAASNSGTTESAADGRYALTLPAGHYHIVIAKDSFLARETDLTSSVR